MMIFMKLKNIKRGRAMQISSRFTIAIHIFDCIETFKGKYKLTSDFLASSVNINPVIIRKILSQLRNSGLVTIARGSGGASIAKPLEEISFLDIYNAVECVEDGTLFHFHENPCEQCPVGRNIHNALDDKLLRIQTAMENEMKKITLADVVCDTAKFIENENK